MTLTKQQTLTLHRIARGEPGPFYWGTLDALVRRGLITYPPAALTDQGRTVVDGP